MSQYINESIEFFQEMLNVNLMDELNIKYKVLDDIDFYNECKKETGSDKLSDFLVLSIPKNEEDCNILLLINDYLEYNRDNYGLEILYSQLSTIYLDYNETINLYKEKYKYLPIKKRIIRGVEYWKEYFSIYFTQTVLQEKNIENIDDEDNPYNNKKSLKIGLNFLNKALTATDKTQEERMSLLFYAFAKISLSEENQNHLYNLKSVIKNENLKNNIQKLYEIFSCKGFKDITIFQFYEIDKLMNSIREEFSKI